MDFMWHEFCSVVVFRACVVIMFSPHGRLNLSDPEPQESAENKYLGNRLLFKLAHQRSFNYQNCIKK
jgi:hypothetical protein